MRKHLLGLTGAVAFAAAMAASPAKAENLTITGAGATFPYPLYMKWADKYNGLTGMKMNYQSIGSGGGIQQIKSKTVDFGASDAPLTKEELDAAGLMQFPMIIGGVVPVLNVEGIQPGPVEIDRQGARRNLPGQGGEVERSGDRGAQPGPETARPGDHGRAPLRRLRDDLDLHQLPLQDVAGMEGEGRVQDLRQVADRRGRQGQRGRRGEREEPDRGRHRIRGVRLRAPDEDVPRANAEPGRQVRGADL